MAKSLLLMLNMLALSLFFISFVFSAPLTDFCVADPRSPASRSGMSCKDPATVTSNDFFFTGLGSPGNTNNPLGSSITSATLATFPGLNTLGITLARIDFARSGIIPPHTHPRATEILTVLEGSIRVGFVTSNPNYTHYYKILEAGDVFVIPPGLVHYQYNNENRNAVVIAALNSENPGIIAIPNAIFGANPDLDSNYLAKAFQLKKNIIDEVLGKF